MHAAPGRPPFRADHIGSLLRPPRLRQAFRDRAAGTLGEDDFRRIQDESIREAVRLQQEAGLAVVTDGEFRRGSYWSRFVERTEGLSVRDARFNFRDEHGHEQSFTAPHVVGRLRRSQPIALDEFAFLREIGATLTPKITLPSPSTMHFWRGAAYAEPGLYADPAAFFDDLAAVYRAEIAELARAGCRYLQLDEVALAMLCDAAARERIAADGGDPEALAHLYVDAINAAVAGHPPELVIGVHLCRGNFKGKYLAEGGYDAIAETLFQRAEVSHFLLEFDTPRAGDFAPLRLVPKAKGVVLGLVSTKTPAIEPLDLLRRRVDEAARHLDLARLALSPQCGFASTVAGNPVTEAVERAKLGRVVEAARLIWGTA
ncbi:MAG TPA: 5-methyltetrahydropteroyltriglutamate--homocysteine S-methyltransferase [Stellaceae bacterium]|jgi:5-methyltetrahydropteroyltriglutamate--homocysteine methyltransferase|nr:5-methyltetrahydropteroyltriglutamate--homocysteine S-methyltransferase [Stellaceae bacterium]